MIRQWHARALQRAAEYCPPTYCPTALLPYCPTALLPYCPTALLPYCPTALLPYSSGSVVNINGKPIALPASVARVAFVSATSRVKTATTQTPF